MVCKVANRRSPRHSGQGDLLAQEEQHPIWLVEAARELGLSPATLEQYLYGPACYQLRLSTAVRKAIAHGRTQVAAHLLAPILAAAQDVQPTSPTSESYVRISEAIADLARDELNYRQTPTRERGMALRRGLERLVTTALALVEGLNRRHEL